MKKLIIANWKMLPTSLAEAQEIVSAANEYFESAGEQIQTGVVFCPPFVFIEEIGKMLSRSHLAHQAELGAQDIFWDDTGADTGEISGPQLAKLGVRYVIIGHSERRWKLGETDEIVNKKLKAALRNEMIPIVCIGERTRSTSSGQARDGNWKEKIAEQVHATFMGLSSDDIGKCIIAYEPVWAISTNPDSRPDTPDSAVESIKLIQRALSEKYKVKGEKFLYGGSITEHNAKDFLECPEFSGILVGGASVRKDEFVKILTDANLIAR